jgi:hypothetical protein
MVPGYMARCTRLTEEETNLEMHGIKAPGPALVDCAAAHHPGRWLRTMPVSKLTPTGFVKLRVADSV